ncbi:methyl-accepting chemotaxis protein [Domibacillus mangrovi]|nr:HAMP domain-containing methyl-accepting chemotaxis protein [Domibacillus mangrovi]
MKKSLHLKMIFIFSSIILLSCIVISYSSYTSSVSLVKDSLSGMAGTIAQQAVKLIDPTKYQQEITLETGETTYYKELREELNSLRENTGLTYLFTMAREKTEKGYEYFYMVDGLPMDDADASQMGEKENVEQYPKIINAFETGTVQIEMSNTEEHGALITTYVPLKSTSGEIIGILGADLDAAQVYDSMAANQKKGIQTTILILFVSVIIVYIFSYYLVKPLKDLSRKVILIGEGDLSIRLKTKRSDEIGVLTNSFHQMANDLKKIISSIHSSSDQLVNASSQLLENTNEVKEGNWQIAVTMQQLSKEADDQADSTSKVSEMMGDITHQLQKATGEGEMLDRSSRNVMELTKNGSYLMNEYETQMDTIHQKVIESIDKVRRLDAQSKEISALVQMIQDIADQTNLLALNAAIEAARAGEHGKGFAVVAEEVRKLATQVTGSVENIVKIVEGVQHESSQTIQVLEQSFTQVVEGADKVKNTKGTFEEINHSVLDIQKQVQSISEYLKLIFKQSEEINQSLDHVASIAVESSAGIEQTSASVQQSTSVMDEIVIRFTSVAHLAEELNHSVGHFKLSEEIDAN